jgi:hypothetical protein
VNTRGLDHEEVTHVAKDNPRPDQRRVVADDARRTVGYMAAVIDRARRADISVPPAIETCVETWRGWFRAMDRRAGEDR